MTKAVGGGLTEHLLSAGPRRVLRVTTFMMRRLFCFLLWMLGVVAGARADQDLYNPMAVGLRWNVDVEMTTPAGEKVQGSAVREITGTETIHDLTYFVVRTSFTGLPKMKDFTTYRRKTMRGIYAINALDKEKREFLEEALPLTTGQSWKTIVFNFLILSTVDETGSVTAGGKTYENCVKVSYRSDGGPSGSYFLAPDIGNVLETWMADGLTYKFTLKSFSGLK